MTSMSKSADSKIATVIFEPALRLCIENFGIPFLNQNDESWISRLEAGGGLISTLTVNIVNESQEFRLYPSRYWFRVHARISSLPKTE